MSTDGDREQTLMRRLRRRLSKIKLGKTEAKITPNTQTISASPPESGTKVTDISVARAEPTNVGLTTQGQVSASISSTSDLKTKRSLKQLPINDPVQNDLRRTDHSAPPPLEQQATHSGKESRLENTGNVHSQKRSRRRKRGLKTTPLLNLPVEMIWEIASFLLPHTVEGANDTWALRLGCKRLFATVDAPSYHLAPKELLPGLVKGIMPPSWGYCTDCNTFHPMGPKDRYTWSHRRTGCVRHLRSHPDLEESILGRDFYLCGWCLERKIRRYCKGCRRCEMCAGAKLSLEEGMTPDSYRNYKGQEFCPRCSANVL